MASDVRLAYRRLGHRGVKTAARSRGFNRFRDASPLLLTSRRRGWRSLAVNTPGDDESTAPPGPLREPPPASLARRFPHIAKSHGGPRLPEDPAGVQPWLGVMFKCCNAYGRLYRDRTGLRYVGRCPRCGGEVSARIGAGGTSRRFFEAV